MKALIIGATGATGRDLVNVLLQDPDYTEVVAFVRRPSTLSHHKYTEVATDFNNLDAVSGTIRGDVWFSCLGTTLKVAGSKQKQWEIDHDIPLKFAQIAKQNGVATAVVVSAYGASIASAAFYSRLKGQLDEDIENLGFDRTVLFRPGLLLRKDSNRSGERMSAQALHFLNSLGLLRRFRPLPTSLLAEKLAKAPKVCAFGRHVIELADIARF